MLRVRLPYALAGEDDTIQFPAPGLAIIQIRGQRIGLPMSVPGALLKATRPRQWPKNLLVFAAPAAAGVLPDQMGIVAIAAVFFVLASAGVYLVNDVIDADADRNHEVKRDRPVASGDLSAGLAVASGVAAMALAVAGAALALRDLRFVAALLLYVVIAVGYSLWLKRIAVVDMLAVASGFIIRSIAGGIAVDVPISKWFVIVVSFGSLFVVAGKRYSEHARVSDGHERVALRAYSGRYLADVRSISAAATLLGYCLWAFEKTEGARGGIWIELSIIPFLAIILRYALIVEDGEGEFPEEILVRDRFVLLAGVALSVLLILGIYAA